jgi:hypothetical protein
MDEGPAKARSINVRVGMKNCASAACGTPAFIAGREAPEATPEPRRGRWDIGKIYLMQRQPRWPAYTKAAGVNRSARRREISRLWLADHRLLASDRASGNR